MHSTLLPNQLSDFHLPLVHQPGESSSYRSHQDRQEYGDHSSRPVRLSDRSLWTATSRDGLRTPPEDMTGANLQPHPSLSYGSRVHGNGNGYFPKPYNPSNNIGFGGIPSTNYKGTSQPVDNRIGPLQSPTSRKDLAAPSDQSQPKSPAGNNSIVSYLQIPSSINNSKGSLAEFAAQVCLDLGCEEGLAWLTVIPDNMSVLVRIVFHPPSGGRVEVDSCPHHGARP